VRTTERHGPRVIFKRNGERVVAVQYLTVKAAKIACIKWWLGLPDDVRTWSIIKSQAYQRPSRVRRRKAA